MEVTGDILIAAPREKVWAGLNDPEVLVRCIPGCAASAMTRHGAEIRHGEELATRPSSGFAGTASVAEMTADPLDCHATLAMTTYKLNGGVSSVRADNT